MLAVAALGCDHEPLVDGGADSGERGSTGTEQAGSDTTPVIPLPRILSRVEEFSGRKVQAAGFLVLDREDRFLFFHKRDFETLMLENSIYVGSVADEMELVKFDDMTVRQYVVIEGFVGRGGLSADHTQFTEVLKIHALEKKNDP